MSSYAPTKEKQYELLGSNLLFYHSLKQKGASAGLLVEGSTDERFYKDKVYDYVYLINVQHLINGAHFDPPTIANCDAVAYLVKSSEINKKLEYYGIIDLDYNESPEELESTNLFITDAHDLEMMLIQCDEDVLNRLEIDITDSEIKTAKILSGELAEVRKALYQSNAVLKHQNLNEKDRTVDYSKLIDGKELSLVKVLDLLNNKRSHSLSDSVYKELLSNLKEECGAHVNRNGIFVLGENKYLNLWLSEIWKAANGHDFCSAIRHVNQKAMVKYQKKPKDPNNLELELAIIQAFDSKQFAKTELYKKLQNAALIKKIQA